MVRGCREPDIWRSGGRRELEYQIGEMRFWSGDRVILANATWLAIRLWTVVTGEGSIVWLVGG